MALFDDIMNGIKPKEEDKPEGSAGADQTDQREEPESTEHKRFISDYHESFVSTFGPRKNPPPDLTIKRE